MRPGPSDEIRTVTIVDPRSIARVTFALMLALSAVVLVGMLCLYLLGLVSGGLGGVEGFIASLGFTGFRVSVLIFLVVFCVAALAGSAVVAALAGLVAMLYNALVPFVGGVSLTSRGR